MILRLAPHLVGDIKNLEDVAAEYAFDPAFQGWITKDRTVRGHIGAPRHATKEKGEWLLENFAGDVIAFLKSVCEA
jgi:creatinine amidohydrolase